MLQIEDIVMPPAISPVASVRENAAAAVARAVQALAIAAIVILIALLVAKPVVLALCIASAAAASAIVLIYHGRSRLKMLRQLEHDLRSFDGIMRYLDMLNRQLGGAHAEDLSELTEALNRLHELAGRACGDQYLNTLVQRVNTVAMRLEHSVRDVQIFEALACIRIYAGQFRRSVDEPAAGTMAPNEAAALV